MRKKMGNYFQISTWCLFPDKIDWMRDLVEGSRDERGDDEGTDCFFVFLNIFRFLITILLDKSPSIPANLKKRERRRYENWLKNEISNSFQKSNKYLSQNKQTKERERDKRERNLIFHHSLFHSLFFLRCNLKQTNKTLKKKDHISLLILFPS